MGSSSNGQRILKMATTIDTQSKQVNTSTIRLQRWAWHNGIMRWHWLPVVSDLRMFWIQIIPNMAGRSLIPI